MEAGTATNAVPAAFRTLMLSRRHTFLIALALAVTAALPAAAAS